MLPLICTTLLLLSASLADQYEQQSRHRFNVPSPRALDLQVGCADGSLNHENHNHGKTHPVLQVIKRLKRQTDQQRQKRDYIQWYGGSTTYHQPNFVSSYQLQSPLPYYIPIWGNPGRIPIFFPTKPILFNPGYPVRNPPGAKTTPKPITEDGVEITIGGRVNVPTTNEEGLPVWGIVEADPTGGSNIGSSSRPNQVPGSSRPSNNRPRRPPTPPLLHSPSIKDQDNQRGQESQQNPQNFEPTPSSIQLNFRPTTTRRPQQAQGSLQGSLQGQAQGSLQGQAQGSQGRQEPSRCVWAIISCCNPTNTQVSYNCFERLGCPGLFVDGSPCTRENTAAALNAAANFYAQS